MRPMFALGCLIVGLALTACGGGSNAFTKDDLSRIVLGSSDAPAGTRFNAENSGLGFLEREGGNAEFFQLLRPFGFVADAGSEFHGSKNAVAYAESLAFLFKDEKGASKALAALHAAIAQLGQDVRNVDSPGLGDESWGASGTFAPNSPPGYFYMWRSGNVVIAFTMSGTPSRVTEEVVREQAADVDRRAS